MVAMPLDQICYIFARHSPGATDAISRTASPPGSVNVTAHVVTRTSRTISATRQQVYLSLARALAPGTSAVSEALACDRLDGVPHAAHHLRRVRCVHRPHRGGPAAVLAPGWRGTSCWNRRADRSAARLAKPPHATGRLAARTLVTTLVVGAVEPWATQKLPGTITLTFVYVGLTQPRWRSLVILPLGIVAFVVSGAMVLPEALPIVVTAAIMWVLVAEVPAWLIAQLEEQGALLRKVAQTDALTQLLDRTTLGAPLSMHASESAVVLIDLDNFKRYNDRHGHEAGDELLVAICRCNPLVSAQGRHRLPHWRRRISDHARGRRSRRGPAGPRPASSALDRARRSGRLQRRDR